MRRAIFLDRDGVINAMVYNADFGLIDSPANPDEFQLLPGAGEAMRKINDMGYLAVVISNQPGIAKGKFSPALLEAITAKMHAELRLHGARLDAVYYCRHHPQGVIDAYRVECSCRKPQPGMLLQAASDLDIDLGRSYLVGDGLTDVQAGQAVGVTSLLVYSSSQLYLAKELSRLNIAPDIIVADLLDAVQAIKELDAHRQPELG